MPIDVLEAVANVATFFGKVLSDDIAVDDLALQLELGIPRESLILARELGNSLGRGDYLKLLNGGIVEWVDLEAVGEEFLVALVGGSRAASIRAAAASMLIPPER